jgi:GTP-binding protein
MGNIVAIVGRPNVGKSTFFNRLVQNRQAIVEETAGVTRDRHYGKTDWNGKQFTIIDTGGYIIGSEDSFEAEIRKQVLLAINEANLVLFLVDVVDGIHVLDQEVSSMLRHATPPVLLVANKADNTTRQTDAHEFYALGLGEIYPISAINGSGTGDLLDEVVRLLPDEPEEEPTDIPKLTVVGRPNVGKSSLINALLGEDRNIVTPIAGTTRDAIHSRYNSFGMDFILVDTAGIRKKNKVSENIEFYSVMRAIRAIEESDVVLLLIDAVEGFEAQDVNIMRLAVKSRKGLVVIVNKWDLIEKSANTHLEFERQIREKMAPFTDVPIVFTSVINKQRIFKAMETAKEVFENRSKKIPTSTLNEVMLPIIESSPPPTASRGKYVKIKYVTQLKVATPQFVFFCNFPNEVKDNYRRFLENKLRENFHFSGVPILIHFRQK